MSWDPVWEEIFRGREWGKYPAEEIIRFVARRYYDAGDRRRVSILDLGCGPGAHLWYLAREGFSAYGIDASPTAIEQARGRLDADGLSAELRVGDLVELRQVFPDVRFDAVVEMAALQCNRLAAVERIVDQAHDLLKPGGRMLTMALARGSWGDGTGSEVEPGTFVGATEGPLQGTGLNHFFTEAELRDVFRRFAAVTIDYSQRTHDDQRHSYKLWVTEAVKADG